VHTNQLDTSAPLTSGSYDVIVVGARVAGAATAMLLARAGVRTLLIDRSTSGSDALSTHALMRPGVLQLSRWGLLDEIVAAGTPPVHRTTFNYGGRPLVVDIKPSHGVDALYAPRRTLLDPVLVGAAAGAGAEVHHNTPVTGLLVEAGKVAGVAVASAGGKGVELRAPLVVGADGMRSTIARLVDAPFTRLGRHAAAVSYGYWPDLALDGFQWNFLRHACSGLIPTNDGLTCVFASAPPSAIGRGGIDVIVDAVHAASPELADRLRTGPQPLGTRSFQGHHGFVRRSHGPGWALVGDAGCFKDPIGAHGITDALRDAELLARAVIGSSLGAGLRTALAEYEETRDRVSAELFEVVDRIAGHEWDEQTIGGVLKQLSASMADELELLSGLDAGAVA
jgi:2-polyprenyl-6-methoxyphenol hydroxylase-like FAD-dependent oxidoreductase